MTGVSRSAAIRRSLLRTERRAASVGWAVKTGRTFRFLTVCGCLQVGVLEPVRRSGEESALGGSLGAQLAAAVHLLGDVRQMEVRGEGADQLGRGLQFGAAQQLGGCIAVLAGQAADLDQFQELGPS